MEPCNIANEPLLQLANRMEKYNRAGFKKRLEVATVCLNLYENMENAFQEYRVKIQLDIMDGFDCFIFENEVLLNISLEVLAYRFLEQLDGTERVVLRVARYGDEADILLCANHLASCGNKKQRCSGTDTLMKGAVESVKGYLELEGVRWLSSCEGQTVSMGVGLKSETWRYKG